MTSDPPTAPDPPTPPAAPVVRVVDPTALLGFAHPLRVRIYDELVARGPATASTLARTFGESSGATSYHLRQLARHGFIEEDSGRGTARDRWWRATPESVAFPKELTSSPATQQAAQLVLREWLQSRHERLVQAHHSMPDWPEPWQDAFVDATAHLRLTSAELAQLGADLEAVVRRWKDATGDRPDDGTLCDVEVRTTTFPIEPPPIVPEDSHASDDR